MPQTETVEMTCPECDGGGEIRTVEYAPQWIRCEVCDGTGKIKVVKA